ncbi:MBL fold metallo-hydrolase [Porphyromonas macacae]|uniref:MBL fold metallo-hydrolase n=1 Tax=Porphyromonas macacae TaxID=28115 RepID=UPI0024ACFFE9|nr:MBL fold metallo-hydrolase [Porphyromonas macacae]
MEVIRTFHPVGQGAFYSERFVKDSKDIGAVVYDCGSGSNKATLKFKKQIKGAFPKGAEIDILFVSHFHADHINGITTLRDNYKIKKVVLPLVHDNDKAVIKIYNFASKGEQAYQETHQIIDNPELFFNSGGNETKIIFVKPVNESQEEFISNNTIPIEKLQTESFIDSYQGIILHDWIYIPFNYKEEDRIKEFKKALSIEGIEVDDWNDSLFENAEIIKKIKKAYNRLPGDLNGNSLMLYSGILDYNKNSHSVGCFLEYSNLHPFWIRSYIDNLNGCLYLGDANLNDPDMFKTIAYTLSPYTPKIGLIQIPHHGSIENFNKEILDINTNNQRYVLSYGVKNAYGHPAHYVMSSILGVGKYLALVNEDSRSIFVQRNRI